MKINPNDPPMDVQKVVAFHTAINTINDAARCLRKAQNVKKKILAAGQLNRASIYFDQGLSVVSPWMLLSDTEIMRSISRDIQTVAGEAKDDGEKAFDLKDINSMASDLEKRVTAIYKRVTDAAMKKINE